MYNNKKNIFVPVKKTVEQKTSEPSLEGNGFIAAMKQETAKAKSYNGSDKFSSVDDEFVTQNTAMASYRKPRTYAEIERDMSRLWAINPTLCVAFTLFIRMITRIIKFADGTQTETTQNGQGMRNEGVIRFLWIGVNHPDTFKKNIHLLIAVGGWRDIFQMLQYELSYGSWENRQLDWNFLGQVILAGLENPNTSELVKKWLPSVKANSAIKTTDAASNNTIAKWLVSLLFKYDTEPQKLNAYKKYRKLKSSGTAHQWQQHISKGNYFEIDFDTIAGRALAQLTSKDWLSKHGLEESYIKWIQSKPVAKFTGFVYELFTEAITSKVKELTVNAQFFGLLKTAGEQEAPNLIVVRDTSGSMSSPVPGANVSANVIAKAMSIFFSYMLKGRFVNHEIVFNHTVGIHEFRGTPVERWKQNHGSGGGSTNLMGVFELLVKMKKEGVAESDFPTTFLIVSDGQFNDDGLRTMGQFETTFARIEKLMQTVFSKEYVSNMKLVLWQMTAAPNTFETFSTKYPNIFYYGGFDPSLIKFLFPQKEVVINNGVETIVEKSAPKNAKELFLNMMNQEVLNMVEI